MLFMLPSNFLNIYLPGMPSGNFDDCFFISDKDNSTIYHELNDIGPVNIKYEDSFLPEKEKGKAMPIEGRDRRIDITPET